MRRKNKRVKQATARSSQSADRLASIRQIFFFILIAVLIAGLGWLWQTLRSDTFLPIQRVEIEGTYTYLDENALREALTASVQTGFLNINVEKIADIVCQQPWVAKARVRRLWPSTLQIMITERKPVARFGNNQLLSDERILFKPDELASFAHLPQLKGPEALAPLMWEQYQQMESLLAPIALHIREVDVTPRRSWTIMLDNGLEIILGQDNVLIRLGRFVAVYPQIVNNTKLDNARVDLRYTNGFAMKP
ncbi:MAG: cell division protein FtsQ [Gammaproteobacteria bacterium]|jgi:cell division protein FtsQ|nr:cell division protein FtsQ [Gammaproteobacteria bacterium]